jgi:NADPH:quinone reductase-like Zn-dependent oxidoreductase
VITTVSRVEQGGVVRTAGADHIVYRHNGDVAKQVLIGNNGNPVDRIVDVALVSNLATNQACLKDGGSISAYGIDSLDATLSVPFLQTMVSNINIRWVFVYGMPKDAHEEAKRDINACITAEAYKPHIGQNFSFNDIVSAHEAQESGKTVGKILVHLD